MSQKTASELTEARIRNEPIPNKGRTIIYDKHPGLCCRITVSGERSLWLYRRVGGVARWIRLGSSPALTVKAARVLVTGIYAQIDRGEKPWLLKKALRDEATLGDLWTHFQSHSAKHKRASSIDEDLSLWRTVLAPWGEKKRVSDITRSSVQKLINDKGKATPTRANRTAALLSAMFNRAIAAELWNGTNPAKGIERFREVSRDRFLKPDELRALFASLAHEEESWRVYFLSALLCGARRANLLAMRWADLDLSRGLWRVDAEESKNGQTMQVVLPEELQRGLSEWKQRCPSPVWCFPSDEAASGHKTEPCKPWMRVLARAECFRLVNVMATELRWPDEQRELELAAVLTETDRLFFEVVGRRVKAPKTADGGTGPQGLVMEALRARATAANLDPLGGSMLDVRMHDLRRTLGSWATMTGSSMTIVGKLLGHRSHLSTAVYARLDLDPARAAVEKAAGAMLQYAEKTTEKTKDARDIK